MRVGLLRLTAVFLVSVALTFAGEEASSSQAAEKISPQLAFASAQAEIVAVLLTERKYSEIFPEFQAILDLGWSGEDETLLVKHAWYVVSELNQADQFSLAHRIVDVTLSQTTDLQNRHALLMLKGKTFKNQELFEQAIEVYRQAQRLAIPTLPIK